LTKLTRRVFIIATYVKLKYTIQLILDKAVVQGELNEELRLHGHKASFVNKKTKKARTIVQARAELSHYQSFHGMD
jgi:hypothetical protein